MFLPTLGEGAVTGFYVGDLWGPRAWQVMKLSYLANTGSILEVVQQMLFDSVFILLHVSFSSVFERDNVAIIGTADGFIKP